MSHWYEFKAKAGAQETEVFLYDEIGGFGISASRFIAELQGVPENHRLVLRIHSPGGSVLEGNAIFNAIKRHKGGVTTHIDGLAASMASIVAIAGAPVKIASNGMVMIHNASAWASGDADDMRKMADLTEKIQETIVQAYVAKTGQSVKKIREMMDAETWMDAKEAKALGFADEITDEIQVAAKFDLSRFRNAHKFDTAHNQNRKPMLIETPEYLALKAEHQKTCELGVTMKANFDAEVAKVIDLTAKLATAETTLATANKSISDLQASIANKDAEHKAALTEFDAKVAAASQRQLAASGTPPVKLGETGAQDAVALYDEFAKADSATATAMFNDPTTGPLIKAESARRHK